MKDADIQNIRRKGYGLPHICDLFHTSHRKKIECEAKNKMAIRFKYYIICVECVTYVFKYAINQAFRQVAHFGTRRISHRNPVTFTLCN